MSVASSADDVVATRAQAEGSAREPLVVLDALEAFLDAHRIGDGAASVTPIGEGHSNVTYLVRRGDGRECVLRRPPRGPLPPSAHDVLREARLLRALSATPVRVPEVVAVEERGDVLGAPFYLMERVDGHVIAQDVPAALDHPAQRRRIAHELVDALVEVHAVDWATAGLADFGRPAGYLERQLRRWSGLWERNRTRDLPAVGRVGRWLADHLPPSGEATVVHGDFRLGNVMFAPRPPVRLVAILDWEMATIGDPLADLGYLAAMWSQRDDPPVRFELSSVTRRDGFPSRDELVARYEERSGRAMTDLRWYQVLALWKAVVFMEGNYRRAVAGTTDDPYLRAFGAGVVELAQRAQDMAHGG